MAHLYGGVEVGDRAAIGRDAMVGEVGRQRRDDVGALKSFDEQFAVVADQTRFERVSAGQGEHRLPLAWGLGVLAPGDHAHLHVVHGRDDIGVALGVAGPLLESAPGFSFGALVLHGHVNESTTGVCAPGWGR